MTDNTPPEVGSIWNANGVTVTVSVITKRGRGYQVGVVSGEGDFTKYRLADFRKQAKPA